MADWKKSFIIYCDLIHTVSKMTNEDAWLLFKHILEYTNDKSPEPPNAIIDLVFEPIKQQLKRDLKERETEREKRSSAGKKWMQKRWGNDNTVIDNITNDNTVINAITPITDNVTVNVNDNVSVSVSDSVIKKNKEKFFSPPLQSEVEQYFTENWYTIASAKKAYNYYNVAWRKDWKGNAVKNRKQKMISVRFKDENRMKVQMKTLTPEEIAERNAR